MYPEEQKPQNAQQPYNAVPTTTMTGAAPKKSPIKLIFIILAGLCVVAVILAVVFSGGEKKSTQQSSQTPAANNTQTPGKASAIDVENVNNSISQSLGSLNEEQDFPEDQLDDKFLGL